MTGGFNGAAVPRSVAGLLALATLVTVLAGCSTPAEPTAADVGYAEPIRLNSSPTDTPTSLPSSLDTQAADTAASAGVAAYQQRLDDEVERAEVVASLGASAYYSFNGEVRGGSVLNAYTKQLARYATDAFVHEAIEVKASIPGYFETLKFERALERGVVTDVSLSDEIDPNLGLLIFDINLDRERRTPATNWDVIESLDLQATVVNENDHWVLKAITPDET